MPTQIIGASTDNNSTDKDELIIIVEGGLVQGIYSNNNNLKIKIKVLDFDNDHKKFDPDKYKHLHQLY